VYNWFKLIFELKAVSLLDHYLAKDVVDIKGGDYEYQPRQK